MKIEIEVPEGDVGKEIHEILKNLGWDQKRELCRQVMLEWLDAGIHKNERELFEKTVVEEIRKSESYYREKSDSDIRSSHTFSQKVQSWRSSREVFIKQISEETIRFYKEQVREVIERDPVIVAMKHEVAQMVKDSFPKMVHDALVTWFAGNMSDIVQGAARGLMAIQDQDQFRQQAADRLNRVAEKLRQS